MSWSCYMQDLTELIEDQLLFVVDDTVSPSPRDLTSGSGSEASTAVVLSKSTFEALMGLDLQPAPSTVDFTTTNTNFSRIKEAVTSNTAELPQLDKCAPETLVSVDELSSTRATSLELSEANILSRSHLMQTLKIAPSNSPCPLTSRSSDTQSAQFDLSSVSNDASKSSISSPPPSPIDPTMADADPVSREGDDDVSTTLPTRKTEDVIADLKSHRILPQDAPAKRRRLSAVGVTDPGAIVDISSSAEQSSLESDDEEGGESARHPRISERKRIMNIVIEDHVRRRAIGQSSKKSRIQPEDEEKQSARWLIDQAEKRQIISTPREYQLELFERAKERNIIAVLDTGSGKTLIAVLLLRHIFAQELEDRAAGKAPRISFFLVDSVTLVFQQHAVLKANLDQPMDLFCGDMGCDLWNRKQWESHFKDNMVIVCTAEVLRQCLHHSFISINQINLLIFDEAHHAKKDHTYARIIKDFYAQAPPGTLRPKIFGMTASPVDARVDVRKAALELEGLLHSQICTVDDPELAKYTVAPSQELIARYAPLGTNVVTSLFSQMRELLGKNKVLQKPLVFAYEATRELGSWCSDQIWSFCLSDEEIKKLSAKTERSFHTGHVKGPLGLLEEQRTKLQDAREVVKTHTFEAPDLKMTNDAATNYTSNNLSSKVVVLARHLRERFQRPTDDKCIIFVKRRYTARILATLLSRPEVGTPHLFVGSLIGTRTGDAGDLNVSFREQVLTMLNFRKGVLNCLIATSVAEEGLDIPDCNLVIRFDLYDTLIQYIQSRGRARHAHSRYVHMIEIGNQQHENMVYEVRRNEGLLKRFCSMLDDDRKLTGSSFDMDYFLKKEKRHRVYIVPSTGAKLTYRMSLMVLANFVDSLPHEGETNLQPEYIIQAHGREFECEVILPEASPVRGAIGRAASTKQVAKCSAAFEACLELIKGKYLDENLLPIYAKRLPAMRNALLAVDSKKREQYDMRTKPRLWSVDSIPEQLFLTILALEEPSCLSRASQPIGILTRTKLVQLPSFTLHFGKDKYSAVNTVPLAQPLDVDAAILAQVDKFTLCIFDDVFSKQYQSDKSKMPYFIVPIIFAANATESANPNDYIDWKVLKGVDEYQTKWGADIWAYKPWKTESDDFFSDKFVVDPFDGGRKLFLNCVAPQYKPLDPVPDNTALRKGRRNKDSHILDYSISLWSKSRASRTFDESQRVFEAQLISLRRNLLDVFEDDEQAAPTKCFIVLESLKVSCLPTSVVAMTLTFPAIIHRIESYLIALEAAELIHINIRPDLALEACTKDSDNSGDHGEDQIKFQRGMGKNYERLEFIGDCFLKMATSISLFGLFPGNDEYRSHVERMCLLCNANLCNNAIKLKLYEYIRSQSFNRRAWYPEGLVLKKGKPGSAPDKHKLGDKSIADVSEALIGAALVNSHDRKNMDDAVRAVTELVCSENHNVKVWSEYYTLYQKPKYQLVEATALQKDMATQIEKKHPYHFRHPRLLRSAFTHPSYPSSYERIPSYQRLEFLGDSLLDMACVNFLFYNYPDKDPQWLTEHKMAMASNQFLGALCVHLELHVHLLCLNSKYQRQIMDYVEEIKEGRLQAQNEAIEKGKDGSDCAPDYWTTVRHPPKCLADIVEAFVGAIFVDSGYDYAEVERFFDAHMRWFFEDMTIYDTYANKQPTTFLTNFLQTNMGCMDWGIMSRELPAFDGSKPQQVSVVILHGKVIADHVSDSSRYGKVAVAKKALEMLQGLPIMDFRKNYGCTCRIEDEEELGEDGKRALDEMHGTAI